MLLALSLSVSPKIIQIRIPISLQTEIMEREGYLQINAIRKPQPSKLPVTVNR